MRIRARQAEEAGFDSIWLYDHMLFRFPGKPTAGIWECWTVLSALAEATSRVELGTLVLCSPFRNPALLAKMAVTLDEVSGGRLILGLGAGWHQPEFDAFGFPFDHRVDRFEEALRIILPLVRAGRVSFQGTHSRAVDAAILPPGPRPNGPPILIGAAEGRDPAALAITVGVGVDFGASAGGAQTAGNAEMALSGSPEEVAAGLRDYARAGVAHVICALEPNNGASLARLTAALAAYRRMGV
jgi:alkanesulfonate monooxygenase SsuD/methylene tetrahydromethanopterin reductase-like flavin-dependent oxidoreductase (luciferase family)